MYSCHTRSPKNFKILIRPPNQTHPMDFLLLLDFHRALQSGWNRLSSIGSVIFLEPLFKGREHSIGAASRLTIFGFLRPQSTFRFAVHEGWLFRTLASDVHRFLVHTRKASCLASPIFSFQHLGTNFAEVTKFRRRFGLRRKLPPELARLVYMVSPRLRFLIFRAFLNKIPFLIFSNEIAPSVG